MTYRLIATNSRAIRFEVENNGVRFFHEHTESTTLVLDCLKSKKKINVFHHKASVFGLDLVSYIFVFMKTFTNLK